MVFYFHSKEVKHCSRRYIEFYKILTWKWSYSWEISKLGFSTIHSHFDRETSTSHLNTRTPNSIFGWEEFHQNFFRNFQPSNENKTVKLSTQEGKALFLYLPDWRKTDENGYPYLNPFPVATRDHSNCWAKIFNDMLCSSSN